MKTAGKEGESENVRSKAATQVRVILTIDGTYPRERHEELHRRARIPIDTFDYEK